jgi:hypothetical protein
VLDSTEFQVTAAIFLNDINASFYYHCFSGVLNQETPFTKICLLDARTDINEHPVMADFFKRARSVTNFNPHYFRCSRNNTPMGYYGIGFQYVRERFTPQTCLYLFLDSSLFLRPTFLTEVKQKFEQNRYTACYRWNCLPHNGDKYLNVNSFLMASQVFHELCRFHDTQESNIHNLLQIISKDIEPPWVESQMLESVAEIL